MDVRAEDMVVIKAIVAAEHTPRHGSCALAILATAEVDWDYLRTPVPVRYP